MKNPPRLLFSLIIASYGFVAGIASAGTVITTNLPSGTTIVNIDSRADGAGAFSSDSAQSFWYQPTPTAPSVTLLAGTYRFRIIDPSDAATLYPNLTSSQRNQIYTGWTFNSPWSENYLVFKSSALNDPNESQLFDAAIDPAFTLYGSAAAAYSGTIANGYYNKIRLAPPGRAGKALCDYEGLYTLSATTTLLFVIPDNGLFDNTGGVSVVVTAVPNPPSSQLQNISTRLRVLTDPNALIGGTIIQGSESKKVLFRALGPTLADPPFNIPGTLADPTMELHMRDSAGHDTLLQTNDNWKINDETGKSQQAAISGTGKAPPKDLESAILMTLAAGNYTAIVRGKNNGVGVGIVEAYDVSPTANSKLINISSRGFVDTGNNVMIGGIVLGPFDAAGSKILVRALGPTLGQFGISNFLADPTMELRNCDGALVASNDDWQSDPESSQIPANKKPPNAKESALYRTLLPSNYTAIVRGKNNATGVALVEVYYLP
jgi:hypothetical protein